ncbi:pentatricopeptide repeat (PPR-like) superfamily protein [Actinidia rufa]|uniref:Pentatricopeptide repeat (PPR-like) superfamily protein n=1 Tax=Actinidia rufa TaxID=165716 RepID=A0A7J0FEM8_9ERIC|nr:pentatricopeptide repeat (PPR-like) superfamily protein [Actinidia rufa]
MVLRCLISVTPHLHLPRPSFPSIFSRRVSDTQNCSNAHNELLDFFDQFLRRCATNQQCQQLHAQILLTGSYHSAFLTARLVSSYCRFGFLDDARKAFETAPIECFSNLLLWNSILRANLTSGAYAEAIRIYIRMRKLGVGADGFTFPLVIRACALFGDSRLCYALNYDSYGAFEMFFKMGLEGLEPNAVTWTSLFSSHARCGLYLETLQFYGEMRTKGIDATAEALAVVVSVCADLGALDMELENSMVRPNVISWSAVIDGFAAKGRGKESLELFRKMQLANISANSITVSSILSVCAELSALGLGREIHGHVIRAIMDRNILVGNGLINMYTKCGSLNEALLVFGKIDGRDLVSWNLMIAGYGMHGLGNNALKTFEQMIKTGYRPDVITFIAVLSACSHAGLVAEGRNLFDEMTRDFGIEPQVEHYACIVDLLGRAGLLQEASDMVRSMPMEPNAYVCGALLNSCRMWKNTGVAEEIASWVFSLDSETTGSYMLLSNIYASTGRWEDSARVRVSAKTKGLKKVPGQSWIEVKKKVEGYLPDKRFVPKDVGEDMNWEWGIEGELSATKPLEPKIAVK